MEKYKKLISNSFVFALGNFGSKLIMFIMLPLYTKYLNTRQYGEVDLVQSTVSLLLPVISLSIFDAVLRFGMEKESDSSGIITNSIVITLIGSLTVLIISIILFFLGIENAIYISLLLIMQAFQSLLSQYSKAIGRVKLFAINGVLLSFLTVVFNIIFLVFMKKGVLGYFISLIFANILSNLYLVKKIDLIQLIDFNKASSIQAKRMLFYSMPLIPNSVAWWLTNTVNRYFVLFFVGASANGLFAVANKVPMLLSVLNSIFFQSWQLSAIEEYSSENRSVFYSKVFNIYCQFLFLSTSAILLILKPLVNIVVDNRFYESWKYVPFLLLSVVYSSISGFLGTNYIAAKKTTGAFYTTIISAVINVVLNFLLIPKFQLFGASLSSAISFLLLCVIRYYDTRRFIITNLNYSSIILNHAIIAIQISFLFVGEDFTVYIIELVLCLISLFINRKSFLPLIKKIL